MLEWDDNANNETGFVLEDGTGTYEIEAGRNTYGPIEGVMGTTIGYRIKGVNDFGESSWAELTYTLGEVSGTELPAPTGVEATAESTAGISIQWYPFVGDPVCPVPYIWVDFCILYKNPDYGPSSWGLERIKG